MSNNTTQKAASEVIHLFNHSAAPDWLTNAIMAALDEVAKIKGIEIYEDTVEGEGFDLEGLAELFAKTKKLDFEIAVKPPIFQQRAESEKDSAALTDESTGYEVDERELDALAIYFARRLQGDEGIAVLMVLLRRLVSVANDHGLFFLGENVDILSSRLFIHCSASDVAKEKFLNASGALADKALEPILRDVVVA